MRGAGRRTICRWLVVLAAISLGGCSFADAPILSPGGPVALASRDTLFRAFLMMMIVVIPVFVLTTWFAWRYRASRGARYEPNWQSRSVDAVVWLVSGAIVVSLGIHGWIFTHRLDPYRPLDRDVAPIEIEVVAQDWKWLFLYPEQQVAAVNEMAIPAGRPVRLLITSDTVMNSFFVPALAGQIYAMPGMQTQLNLMADEPGAFVGRNTQYSGAGFPNQNFVVRAHSEADFEAWVTAARRSGQALDAAAYAELARPTVSHPVTHYASFEPGLFAAIIGRYDPSMATHIATGHAARPATATE